MKQRFKRMRCRSVRFYVLDVNTDYSIQAPGLESMTSFPQFIFYPAFHKETLSHRYHSKVDAIEMAKFIKKHADIKVELKKTYFTPKDGPDPNANYIEMDEHGNMKPDPDVIRKMQDK